MRTFIRSTAAFLVLCAAASSHGQTTGGLFPLTNTRYGSAPAVPLLRTNGTDFFLFWLSDSKLRATKLDDGRARTGHVVLDAREYFDVVWTGRDFIALAQQQSGTILGQRLDVSARPTGAAFPVVERASEVNLAANGDRLLVVYKGWDEVSMQSRSRVLLLTASGKPAGMSGVLHGQGGRAAVAASESGFLIARMTADGLTLTGFDRGGFVTAHTLISPQQEFSDNIALASKGSGSLLAWSEFNRVLAVPVSAQGTPGMPVIIDQSEEGLGAPSATWSGNGWSVAYSGPAGKVRVAHLDRLVQQVMDREQSITVSSNPSLAAIENQILLARRGIGAAPAHVTLLPLAANEPRDATFTATRQKYLATASSANGTLVVWREQGDGKASIRAGVRRHDGNWSEYEIGSDAISQNEGFAQTEASAASDGRGFVVLVDRNGGVEAIRLDERGRPLGAALPLSQQRHAAIAWNGREYGIVAGAIGRLLSPSGTLSPPVAVEIGGDSVRSLASNGSGFVLTSGQTHCYFEGSCVSGGLFVLRLGPDLRSQESALVLADFDAFNAGYATDIIWNGSTYTTLWGTDQTTWMASISPEGAGRVQIRAVDVPLRGEEQPTVVLTGAGALTISSAAGKLTTVNRDGAVLDRIDTGFGSVTSSPGLASLPGGRVAYLASSVHDAAPYHGASRVMMAILGTSLPPPPSPPQIAVSQSDARWTVAWQAPSGAVNGYRLEYRIDDGSWVELERWLSPGELEISLRKPYAGSSIAVRARAFNDGGVSEYSNIATPPVRRRAIR